MHHVSFSNGITRKWVSFFILIVEIQNNVLIGLYFSKEMKDALILQQ